MQEQLKAYLEGDDVPARIQPTLEALIAVVSAAEEVDTWNWSNTVDGSMLSDITNLSRALSRLAECVKEGAE